jgi:hypothetical protein
MVAFINLFSKKCALLCISTVLLLLPTAEPFAGYSWKTLETTGTLLPREEDDLVNVGGLFYLIGGRGIQNTQAFNPATNTWAELDRPPLELHHFQSVLIGGKIYICGAMTDKYPHERPVPNIYIFDPKANTWTVGPAIPADRLRGSGGTVLYHNKIYTACGIQDGHWTGNVAWFDEFDPKTGQWTKLPDAPIPRDHFKASLVGGKLYCIGGNQSDAKEGKVIDKTINEVDVYDFATAKWTVAQATLPTPRAGCSTAVAGNDIIIAGGETVDQLPAHKQVEAYNVITKQFRTLPPLNSGRHGTGALFYQQKIYIAAGVGNRGGGPLLNSIECFSK